MEPPGGRDSRFQLGYSMNLLSGETPPEIYGGGSGLGRPSTSLQQLSPRHTMVSSACGSRGGGGGGGAIKTDVCYDDRGGGGGGGMGNPQHGGGMGFDTGSGGGGVTDIHDDSYGPLQSKKSPPSNGKKTKGRVKIKMEYIENKLRRYTTFSKRKTGIMKKAYELSTLTGTQVMLLVASETGHVYTFATRKLQPMITSEAGKALIQTCLNSPDPPAGASGGDQRMSATGFEETELTYNISDEDSKELGCDSSEAEDYDDDGSDEEEEPPRKVFVSSTTTAAFQQDSSKACADSSSSPLSSSSSLSLADVKKEPTDAIGNKAKAQDADENAKIISQIKQINDALIQSNNKAKAASNQSDVTTTTTTATVAGGGGSGGSGGGQQPLLPQPSVLVSSAQVATVQLSDNVKAVPLIVQSGNGLGFASTPDGMILGVIQGGPESKIVAMPLNSVIAGGIRVATAPLKTGNVSGADSSDSCSDDDMNGADHEPLNVFVTPDHEVFTSISPPSSPVDHPKPPPPAASSAHRSAQQQQQQRQSLLSPLMYQTPQGMMYATPSNGGLLLSLATQGGGGGDASGTKQQFITIPLSMVSNGQAGSDLELGKRNK